MYRVRRNDSRFEVEIEDETPEAVFREAIVAFGDLLTERRGGEPLAHPVELSAANLSDLLRSLLEELMGLDRADDFVTERATSLAIAGTAVEARIGGQRLDHDRAIAGIESAEVSQADDATWHARLVFGRA